MSEQNPPSHLDPRLQKTIARSQAGTNENFETSEEAEELVSVIAKVKNVQTFLDLPGVYQGKRITLAPDKSGHIVTAKVSVSRLEQIQQSSVVMTLSSAQPIKLMLKDTLREIGLSAPGPLEMNGGNGVIIGIIDHGCDFAHQNFRNSDGTTRLLSLMTQSVNLINGQTKEIIYTPDKINTALQNINPYQQLGYDPGYSSHGTHVMDIAAGNGLAKMSPGVAPKADIIFVDPDYRDIQNGELGNFADSRNLLNSVKYVFDEAGATPCVINISLGTYGGPHDGTSLVEQGIDGLVMEQTNRAVVIAAGNAFDDRIHASGTITEGSFTDLHWEVFEGDTTNNEVEIWYSGEDEFRIELLNRDHQSIFNIGVGEKADSPGFFAAHTKGSNGDHQAMIFSGSGLAGVWIVRIHGVKAAHGTFHAWIERDDNRNLHKFNQSRFQSPVDNTCTLGSICCGQKSIVVGSYNGKDPSLPISYFSSAGPTRDGRQKPEISAPGHFIIAACSRTINEPKIDSGTSMAAPVVTGVIALMLAEAVKYDLKLSIDEIRRLLFSTTKRNPPAEQGWNNQYGNGRVNAVAAVKSVTALVGNMPVPS
ncbi:S8 family serine peptidase [Paenibacillus riograndensis]|uniref:Peptidase S8 and S53 subtilisin kexin sedolisin n=2 Tax=Paenibacillus riograndensis TaxID=483937 RepID=A0A0E4H8N8_9BACL|nr:S8 family serine peptidase [Paenibacillus riograndensis]CQR54365.1 Peptidase S8 and S53 subtilisin kexin sedolisin [Paenibacillus riograndensis SBR5]